ncbi:hypothetical protein LCGC14_1340720 [marine sediment metagenome]|uniref:Uncharacterized protein n=1 Tax=marine sediment metagenome TaxID=412755 RepID=A0A0F9KDN8_9ZZZZ
MATVFDEVSIKGLRVTHFYQLLSYMKDRDEAGWYYGNREQFEQRHKDLQKWLEGIIDYASSEGIIIPKK